MHPSETDLLHTFTPISRESGSVYDIITTATGEKYYVCKSEDFPLHQEHTALRLKFWVLDSILTETYVLVRDVNFNLSTGQSESFGSEIEFLNAHVELSINAHSKSCAGVTIAISNNMVSHYNFGDEYWIPFWGYNDTGTILAQNQYHRFAFYYVCNKSHFEDFKLAAQGGRIKYGTKFPFHDEPVRHPTRPCWIHRDLGLPI